MLKVSAVRVDLNNQLLFIMNCTFKINSLENSSKNDDTQLRQLIHIII